MFRSTETQLNEVPPSQEVMAIYTSKAQGEPMISHEVINVTENGLEGDRYESGTGFYSKKRIPDTDRAVTFISPRALKKANVDLANLGIKPFTLEETRRNIGVDVDPDLLVELKNNKRFQIGDVIFEGTDLCAPCMRPGELTGRPISEQQAFIKAFLNRGGLRAKVIQGGTIKRGSKMIPL